MHVSKLSTVQNDYSNPQPGNEAFKNRYRKTRKTKYPENSESYFTVNIPSQLLRLIAKQQA